MRSEANARAVKLSETVDAHLAAHLLPHLLAALIKQLQQLAVAESLAQRVAGGDDYQRFFSILVEDVPLLNAVAVVHTESLERLQYAGGEKEGVALYDVAHHRDGGGEQLLVIRQLLPYMFRREHRVHPGIVLFRQEIGHILHHKVRNLRNLAVVHTVKHALDQCCRIGLKAFGQQVGGRAEQLEVGFAGGVGRRDVDHNLVVAAQV